MLPSCVPMLSVCPFKVTNSAPAMAKSSLISYILRSPSGVNEAWPVANSMLQSRFETTVPVSPLGLKLATSASAPLCESIEEAPKTYEVSRSEEHTSELQSRLHLVCRLLLEKKITFTFSQPNDLDTVIRILAQVITDLEG